MPAPTRPIPPERQRWRYALGAMIVASLVLAACGGNDDDEGAATTTGPDQTTTTTTAGATAGASEDQAGEAVPSPGCGTSEVEAVTEQRQDLTVDGTDRWYLLTTPSAHDGTEPLPLVLDFHGLSEGAEAHAMQSDLSPVAEEEGFVVAFPNGTGSPVRWNVGGEPDDNADLAFTEAMLDQMGSELCIDTSRVYATGLSNGAMMSSYLGCTLEDRIAAIAPVAGITTFDGCEQDRPMPALAFHGTGDPILLFNGGVGKLGELTSGDVTYDDIDLPEADLDGEGYPATAATWAERNGCEPGPTDEKISDEVIRRTWDCPPGAETRFDIIIGGGHTWPGSEFADQISQVVGPTTFDIDGSAEIWEFFADHRLPEG